MGSPSCGKWPSRERDRNSTMEGEGGREAGGRGGGLGPGVLNNENNASIHSQPSLIGRLI